MSVELVPPTVHTEWMAERIERQSLHQPSAIAIRTAAGSCTYAELMEQAVDSKRRLSYLRLPDNACIGVVAHKTVSTVALALAAMRRRHPVLLVSPTMPDHSRHQVLQAAGSTCLIDSSAGSWSTIHSSGGPNPSPNDDDPPMMLMTTSGSTGRPKVVRLSAVAVSSFMDWASQTFNMTPGRSVLSLAPLNFDLSILELWSSMCHGATVTMVKDHLAVRGQHVRNLILRDGIHVVEGVPTLLDVVLDHDGDWNAYSVEHVILTGEPAPPELVDRVRRSFPRASIHNVYGATETNDSFLYTVPDPAPSPLPIGYPLPGVEARLVDRAGAVIDGPGSGELYVSGPFVATGYSDPHRTSAAFVSLAGSHQPFYRTGDIVHRDEGGIHVYQGRRDRQVKVRGVMVDLDGVESSLADCPGVIEAAVSLAEVRGRSAIVAAVRVGSSYTADSDVDVRLHCASRLPRTAIPSTFLVSRDPLPRTATGKIDRRAAVKPAAEQ